MMVSFLSFSILDVFFRFTLPVYEFIRVEAYEQLLEGERKIVGTKLNDMTTLSSINPANPSGKDSCAVDTSLPLSAVTY